MRNNWITLGLAWLLSLACAGDALALTRRSVEGPVMRRPLVERNPDSLPLPARAGAYSARLLPGSKAPALPELAPVRGGEIKEMPAGLVTVVEFWASWCPNCRERAFQIGELERKHPGEVRELAIVLPDRFGSSEAGARELAGLASGVDALGCIGWDVKGTSRAGWLTPSRRATVPSAFIVDGEGVIAWIGHAGDAGDAVSKLLNGEWSSEEETHEYVQRFREGEWRDEASQRYNQAARAGDWDAMLRALDDLDMFDPGIAGGTAADSIRQMMGNARDRAFRLALVTEKAVWEQDPHLLNDIAWYFLIATEPAEEEVTAALRMARRASELSHHEDGLIEDTLGLALYRDGDRDGAISTQERAIRLIEASAPTETRVLTEFRDRLRMYRESEPITTRQRKRSRDPDASVQPPR